MMRERKVLREILTQDRERIGGQWVARGSLQVATDDVARAAVFVPNPPGYPLNPPAAFREVDAAAVFRGELQAARERVEQLAARLEEVER
jgi:hypothetical protein